MRGGHERNFTRRSLCRSQRFRGGSSMAQLQLPTPAARQGIHQVVTPMPNRAPAWAARLCSEKITMVSFRIYILLRKQDYTGGSVGSTINHFGLYVKDFDGAAAKWKAAGLTWEPAQPGQGFLTGPDSVRVEIYENKTIPTPMQMHHIHLMVPDPLEAQKWYIQHFGATAGKRLQFETANVPGTEITLGKADKPQVPTKGRSVDHMGFEVKNIDAFVAKLLVRYQSDAVSAH